MYNYTCLNCTPVYRNSGVDLDTAIYIFIGGYYVNS